MKRTTVAVVVTSMVTSILGSLLLGIGVAHADTIKPGLWKITSKTTGAAVSAVAGIPEEHRKQAEAMGIKLPRTEDDGIVSKSHACITPEQAKQGVPPNVGKDQEQCQQSDIKTHGNTTTWKTICAGKYKASGTGSVTYEGPERFNGEAVVNVTDAPAGFNTVNTTFAGTYVSADCPQKTSP